MMDLQLQPGVAYPMSRRWLIAVSVTAHLAVGAGLFVSGVWRIERLHADPVRNELVLPLAPPAPSGGPVAARMPEINRKPPKRVPHETVQPVAKLDDKKPDQPPGDDHTGLIKGPGDPEDTGHCTENCVETKAAVAMCGDSSVDLGEQCDDGNTANGDGCSSTCRIEVKPQPPQPPRPVDPRVFQGLRISGETQLHPSTTTQSVMLRDGVSHVAGTIKLCITTDGGVASASMARSTKYDDYDATLLSAVRTWRYQPYTLNGTPVPACSFVTFNYTIQ
jgi:TonB family protein